jgi:hypothetical protein
MSLQIKRFAIVGASFAVALAAFSSCSNDPTLTGTNNPQNQIFNQVDRVGNPGLTEVFSPWARHNASNRATPLADATAMQSDITSFVSTYGGRSAAIQNFIADILVPDVLVADTSQLASGASYLGYYTAGQINDYCAPYVKPGQGLFGGRGLQEDVVTTTFSLIFGSLVPQISAGSTVPGLPAMTAIPDDGKEKNGLNGTPQLTTDNVGCSGKHFTFAQFPYLGAPY